MPVDLRPSQFQQGVPFERALSICGPTLVYAFMAANGRPPSTVAEITQLAEEGGLWKQGVGMFGPQAEVTLMRKMGIEADYSPGVDWRQVAVRAGRGELIGLSTPNHYWSISGYDPDTGRYYVGTSGTDMKRGAAWMTSDQIADVGGGLHGIITTGQTPRARQQFAEANAPMESAPATRPVAPATPDVAPATNPVAAPPMSPDVSSPMPPNATSPIEAPPQVASPFVMPGAADDPVAAAERARADALAEQRRREQEERRRQRDAFARSLVAGFGQQPAEEFALPPSGLEMPTLKMPGGFRLPPVVGVV